MTSYSLSIWPNCGLPTRRSMEMKAAKKRKTQVWVKLMWRTPAIWPSENNRHINRFHHRRNLQRANVHNQLAKYSAPDPSFWLLNHSENFVDLWCFSPYLFSILVFYFQNTEIVCHVLNHSFENHIISSCSGKEFDGNIYRIRSCFFLTFFPSHIAHSFPFRLSAVSLFYSL